MNQSIISFVQFFLFCFTDYLSKYKKNRDDSYSFLWTHISSKRYKKENGIVNKAVSNNSSHISLSLSLSSSLVDLGNIPFLSNSSISEGVGDPSLDIVDSDADAGEGLGLIKGSFEEVGIVFGCFNGISGFLWFLI